METTTKLLTIEEVRGLLKVSRTTAYELVRSQRLPVVRVGRCLRVHEADLARFLAEQRTG